jgi:alkanesulfonate monooxygenase SsuD/methylene tetrahydromethanopterin reductase-like flavin-dependent oxidoreductase (luciferase family)
MHYRPLDLTEAAKYRSPWVVLPNLYDPVKGAEEYARHIDALVYAEELGFDAIGVNEHHQTAYGLMPAPNLIASALIQRTKTIKIAILGRALPLVNNPVYIAEEFAMLDNLSKGRIIAGFVRGIGSEYHSSGTNPYFSHERFHEAHDLIIRAWTEPGPFAFDGDHFSLRYVNLWPRPYQTPHPPVWISVAGVERDGCLVSRSQTQISVPGDLLIGRPRGALPQHLSRSSTAIRLRGCGGSARLGLSDLCR